MYGRPGIIYGFHGCDRRIGEAVLASHVHQVRKDAGLPNYDTVIGALGEGIDLYEDAGITDKNHMQICVRSAECVRGYFRVREVEGIDLLRWDSHPHRARISP